MTPNSVAIRIIPADAGSTSIIFTYLISNLDHPRGFGEHTNSNDYMSTTDGSSPRMRGALDLRDRKYDGSRIIPADAGSTEAFGRGADGREDHPRGCGEHF